jgi:hypothetical protein
LPAPLKGVQFPEDFWLIAILSRYRHDLQQVHDGTVGVRKLAKELTADSRGKDVLRGRDAGLYPVDDLCREMLSHLDEYDPVKIILAVNEDVLGIYRYRLPSRLWPEDDPWNGEIELYWGVIGLVGSALGVAVEDLTVVVLAHELAHAYTHLGSDIDGRRWGSVDFSTSAHELKEGLAQYYTHRVLDRLRPKLSGAFAAFELLVPKQPGAYQVHSNWIKNYSPEEVRLAMIEARRKGPGMLAAFEERLESARAQLESSAR